MHILIDNAKYISHKTVFLKRSPLHCSRHGKIRLIVLVVRPSVCLSVYLSVTLVLMVAKHTQLVFGMKVTT